MNLRIVKCSRGELVTGFRVQREVYRRIKDDSENFGRMQPVWANTGRKCYSTDEAREYRDFLLKHADRYSTETLEVVEDSPAADRFTEAVAYRQKY